MEGSNRIDVNARLPLNNSNNLSPADKQAEEKEKELKKACANFESVLVYYLFKSMRQTIPAGGLLDKFPGKDTYTMMMDQKVAEEMAHRGDGLGIQKMLFNQLNRKPPKKGEGEF
ncbi:MAG: rod-binding protein [Deltaproteobacteria bacterium]|nr:rod-binding protein [Deltaproteobacteria bacterium]